MELVVFDKDGTLIDFDAMWVPWVSDLAVALAAATGRPVEGPVHLAMGVDPRRHRLLPDAPVAVATMAQLGELCVAVVVASGATPRNAERAVADAWRAPDPVTTARPLADLQALFRTLRAGSRRIAIVTTDDRAASEATVEALGLAGLVDAMACGDDGLAVKPAPDALLHVCRQVGVEPARTAMVGDTTADLRMGRAAGVRSVIGVLSGTADHRTLGPLADHLIASVADLVR